MYVFIEEGLYDLFLVVHQAQPWQTQVTCVALSSLKCNVRVTVFIPTFFPSCLTIVLHFMPRINIRVCPCTYASQYYVPFVCFGGAIIPLSLSVDLSGDLQTASVSVTSWLVRVSWGVPCSKERLRCVVYWVCAPGITDVLWICMK